jgi:Ca2+-binding RTX toxin-like protein
MYHGSRSSLYANRHVEHFGILRDVTKYNSSEIVISDGYSTTRYTGDFGFDFYGDVYGTLRGYTNTFNGRETVEVSSINRDAGRFSDLLDRNDVDGLYKLVLSGGDKIYGSGSRDRLLSFGGSDLIEGRGGSDHLRGGTGGDRLFGGAGNDHLYGEAGADVMLGGSGNDRLFGGGGNDRLLGGSGSDRLSGEDGADQLSAGRGADILIGGDGADRFVFKAAAEAGKGKFCDVIEDFSHAERDKVVLRQIDADTTKAGHQDFAFIGGKGFSGDAGELISRKGLLLADIDGDGSADLRLDFANDVTLLAGDLLI